MIRRGDRPRAGAQPVEVEGRADLVIEGGHGRLRPAGLAGQIADVGGRHQRPEQGDVARHRLGSPKADERLHPALETALLEARQDRAADGAQGVRRRPIGGDQGLDRGAGADRPAGQPEGLAAQHHRNLLVQRALGLGRDLQVQRRNLVPGLVEPEDLARRLEGENHGRRIAAGRLAQALREGRTAHIDDLVRQDGRDDLATQAVALHVGFEFRQRGREIADQRLFEEGVVRGRRGDDLVEQLQLGIGGQDRQFGPGQGLAGELALRQFGVVRQALDLAVQLALGAQPQHELLLGIERPGTVIFLQRHRQGLVVVVRQHLEADLIGHRGQQGVAIAGLECAGGDGRPGQDLDVDLMVGAVDAGRVVDGVGVDAAPCLGEGDAARLGQTEVGTLADHLGAQFAAVDADGVIGLVADLGVGLVRCLHIGADAAEIEQFGRGQQDGLHQRRRIDDVVLDVERRLDLGAQFDRLGRAREDAAAL